MSGKYHAQGELAAAREHAAISIARAASAELLAAAAATLSAERDAARAEADGLRALLARIAPVLRMVPWTGAPYDGAIDVALRAIDALLAARAQPPAKTAGTGDGDKYA